MKKYVAFEGEVGRYITKICRKHYALCKGACCRAEICMESVTSPFLRQLRQRFAPDAVFSDRRGWMTETGCALPVGRPPVCYQFFCEVIFEDWPTVEFCYAVTVLSNLVNHAGKKALGQKHIVELQQDNELKRINYTRIEKQLEEAGTAFKMVRAYLDGDVTKSGALRDLKKISSPSRWQTKNPPPGRQSS